MLAVSHISNPSPIQNPHSLSPLSSSPFPLPFRLFPIFTDLAAIISLGSGDRRAGMRGTTHEPAYLENR